MFSVNTYFVWIFLLSIKGSCIHCVVREKDPALPKFDITKHKNWHLLNHKDCGLSLSDKIIGGKNASLGQYPWIARIGYSKKIDPADYYDDSELHFIGHNKILVFECGGTLISSRYVVTAAHCTVGIPDNSILTHIRLGEYNDLTEKDCDEDKVCAEPVQDFKPQKIIPHPEYSSQLYKHDIALIRLNRPYLKNGWVFPVCSISGKLLHKDYVGEYGEIIGWGYTDEEDEKVAHILQTVQLPVVHISQCNNAYRRTTTIGNSQLCVGGILGMDSCGGDSGGPLLKVESVKNQPPKYFLIGIVSFGSKYCGTSTKPAVYTRIANYMPWILANIY